MSERRTGYVWDERYGWHDTGTYAGAIPAGGWVQPYHHFESPESKQRLAQLVAASGLERELAAIDARFATDDEILRVHTEEHLAYLQSQSDALRGGVCEDGISPIGHGSMEIARLAAGGVMEAVDAVIEGRVENAYALVRPPGHHATADAGMGFCMINNIAIAVAHARRVRGIERIAIVDWDVHHGNGTQDIFYEDPLTLTVSLHQDRCYPPDSGFLTERGRADGAGAALNIPLPPGSGRAAYLDAFERGVIPAVSAFQPELIIVASGYDASILDPLGRQMLTSATYRTMTARILELAEAHAGGRVVVVHEGGYSPAYVPFCGLAVLEELAGRSTDVMDPFAPFLEAMAGQELTNQQKALVDAVVKTLTNQPAPAFA
ncbi:class II histone deacetylase [Agromyces sp. NPDC049794]|uniref:class II histone deacetylase n=1 Tax=unclassified Agromyces TaxID=2639701 RepID=UPI0033C486D9